GPAIAKLGSLASENEKDRPQSRVAHDKLVQGGTAVRKKMLLSVAMAGLMTVPASAAWPSFTGTKSKPTPPSQSTSWFGASSPASESAPAAEIPSYLPPGAQPETRTQKLARKMNPLNWIGS